MSSKEPSPSTGQNGEAAPRAKAATRAASGKSAGKKATASKKSPAAKKTAEARKPSAAKKPSSAKKSSASSKPAADTGPAGPTTAFFGADGPLATLLRNIDARNMVEQSVEFTKTLFSIAAGQSDIAPDKKDWRFQDPAWTSNPAYKRLAQAYLAMTDAVEKMIPQDLSDENRQRAQLAASIVTSTMAPTNTLIGNPAALTKTIQTGGGNLARGFAAMVRDMKGKRRPAAAGG